MGAQGGFWSIFTKNFRMSGYDNWSWITISSMRIHFETARHPLYLTFLYPLYLLNSWLIQNVGYNFAVYFMAIIIIFSAFYAVVFMYRIFREVIELSQADSTLLTLLLFSFWTCLGSINGPRSFHHFPDVIVHDHVYHRHKD